MSPRETLPTRSGWSSARCACAFSHSSSSSSPWTSLPHTQLIRLIRLTGSTVSSLDGYHGGGLCTQRPATIVATTCASRSSHGSRSSTTSAAALVAGEPRGCDARGAERLLDRHGLLPPPRPALVDRPADPGADPRQGIELLDRRVGAVRDQRARLEQRPEGVRPVEPVAPVALGEVAVGRRVRELHRARDAELGEPRQILG